jgi:hypothetical protein
LGGRFINASGASRREDEVVSETNDERPVVIAAVSLVASRSQFTQAAYKTSHLESFELNSFEMRCPQQICS